MKNETQIELTIKRWNGTNWICEDKLKLTPDDTVSYLESKYTINKRKKKKFLLSLR